MLKQLSFVLLRNYFLMSFALMMCAVFVLGAGTTPSQAAKKTDAQKSIAALVDINSATQKELEDIKGVGPASAKKIIAGRPYKSVDELSKAGLSAKAVEAMKPFVIVGKVQAAPVTATAAKAATKGNRSGIRGYNRPDQDDKRCQGNG
ncbi:MAG: helix-hairpin-helix domain-containing protein [Desulfobacterales bacterium]|nr:helix-hairpin-helix domain-containing protein [Desulfobacterales bacterium]